MLQLRMGVYAGLSSILLLIGCTTKKNSTPDLSALYGYYSIIENYQNNCVVLIESSGKTTSWREEKGKIVIVHGHYSVHPTEAAIRIRWNDRSISPLLKFNARERTLTAQQIAAGELVMIQVSPMVPRLTDVSWELINSKNFTQPFDSSFSRKSPAFYVSDADSSVHFRTKTQRNIFALRWDATGGWKALSEPTHFLGEKSNSTDFHFLEILQYADRYQIEGPLLHLYQGRLKIGTFQANFLQILM